MTSLYGQGGMDPNQPASVPGNATGMPAQSGAQMGSQLLYDGDPQMAMMAAMRSMGINPFQSGNPFIQMLLQAASGLQTAHRLHNIGARSDDVNALGGPGQMFGDFLRNQLQTGQVHSTLANTARQLPQYAQQLMALPGQINQPGGMDVTQVSPFARAMDQMFSTPEGLGQAMTSLNAPILGSLAKPWSQGVGAGLASNWMGMVEDVGRRVQDDPMAWQNSSFLRSVFGR